MDTGPFDKGSGPAHVAGIGFDAVVASLSAAVMSLSFLERVNLVVQIVLGLVTIIFVLLGIRNRWRKRGSNGTTLGLFIGAIILLAAITAAAAPPQNADPSLAPWFRSLTNPNVGGMSCCAEADGHILRDSDWRVAGDHYQIRIGTEWVDVPLQAVLNRVDNPTGGAVAFYPSGIETPPIYCFVRPVES
jgi:hypothetical protein